MNEKDSGYKSRLTLDAVREFLIRHDGKVKQDVLVNFFRAELTNPSTKVRVRQEFKHILQLITAVKFENGEKYIVLTKQNQEHISLSLISRKSKRSDSLRKDKVELLKTGGYSSGDSESNLGTSTESVSDKNVASSDTARSSGVSDEDLADDIGLNGKEGVQPIEKEWMLAGSRGKLNDITRLLKKSPRLLSNRDFLFGYTVLHWAVKIGRSDIIDFTIESGIDINSKSHGGYTPLHLASMSGKDDIIVQLLELGANIYVRDHSGRKPKDIVKDSVAPNVQRMLGKTVVINPNDPPPNVLQNTITNTPNLQRARQNGTSFSSDSTGGEFSPDFARRSFKSAQSFLRKKINSPLMERAKSSIANMTNSKVKSTPTLERKLEPDSFNGNGSPGEH